MIPSKQQQHEKIRIFGDGSSKCPHGKLHLLSLSIHVLTEQVGTGEYTTGFVGGGASGSDKKVGVVGLTLFDLRRRGKVGELSMVGVSGRKFPAISASSLTFLLTFLGDNKS